MTASVGRTVMFNTLAQLAAAEARMTPGRWIADGPRVLSAPLRLQEPDGPRELLAYCGGTRLDSLVDAAGIAALRNAAPALIAVAEAGLRLRESMESVRWVVRECDVDAALASAAADFDAAVRDALARLAGEAGDGVGGGDA